ncbi:Tn3 family transposase [Krasilnikovia cinnamomea]|uniref:Tn3 family transposase n=1 Tax=Krasilnikovia cinnamomea TaxID=349313 RepID=UPI00102BAB7C|nr:Tn3 family transposase [Krasilnikovia cinnamomea]
MAGTTPLRVTRRQVRAERLALHLLQTALVHVNTALLQVIPSEPEWAARMTDADRRALTPLFWTPVFLYGRFDLDMDNHLNLDQALPCSALPAARTESKAGPTMPRQPPRSGQRLTANRPQDPLPCGSP